MGFDQPVAGQQIVDVAVEKAEFPDRLEQQVEEKPDVLRLVRALPRGAEQVADFALVVGKKRVDDLVLVVEVVVEIAGADLHFVGDHRRRDVRLAEVVEQAQGGFENPLAGAPSGFAFHALAPGLGFGVLRIHQLPAPRSVSQDCNSSRAWSSA